MKKTIFTIFVVVLTLMCAVSAFAYRGHMVTWDEEGTIGSDGNSVILGKSLNDGGIANEQNQIRRSWTASRAMPQENAMFVELENGASDGVCVKIINTEYMTNDPEADGKLMGTAYVSLDMRCDKVGAFCGMVIDFGGDEEGFNSSSYADFEATNETFILNTGYGFSVLDNGKIRAFVNADGEKPTYYDFDLPFDPKTEFHNYGLYKDEDEGVAYLTVDGKYIAKYEFPGVKSKQGIFDANGNGVALGAEEMTGDGNIWFATVGECEVYIDNVIYDAFEEYPEPLKTASDATAAPADATEAPADATQAPADPTAEPKKEGCGNVISGGAVILAAACAVLLKKRENQ